MLRQCQEQLDEFSNAPKFATVRYIKQSQPVSVFFVLSVFLQEEEKSYLFLNLTKLEFYLTL